MTRFFTRRSPEHSGRRRACFRRYAFLLLAAWASHAAAQAQPLSQHRRWETNLSVGYQAVSQPQSHQRYTDVLLGRPSAGLAWALDFGYFWNEHWGGFVAARLSQTPLDWPGALQQALERDYPGKLVRITLSKGGEWDGSVSQAMFGVRRRFFLKKNSLQPSLAMGFSEVQISNGGADLKTPGSNALSNVFAYTTEGDPWISSVALDVGGRAEWPLSSRFSFTASANWMWAKPEAVFEFYEVDQVTGVLRREQLRYERAQNLLVLAAGLSWHFGKRR